MRVNYESLRKSLEEEVGERLLFIGEIEAIARRHNYNGTTRALKKHSLLLEGKRARAVGDRTLPLLYTYGAVLEAFKDIIGKGSMNPLVYSTIEEFITNGYLVPSDTDTCFSGAIARDGLGALRKVDKVHQDRRSNHR